MEDKRLAVLIDSDNISQKYCKYILDELTEYGTATYKRIYGDWTNPRSSWKDVLLEHSITPIQQYSYTTGKNATDSAMIIDAMDILYTGHVDGFCIVTSDSDFTKLASRLRESGMLVIGMGEKKTPSPFRVACDKFIYLDVLMSEEDEVEGTAKIENVIVKILAENEGRSKMTGIGEIGSRLAKTFSDFDVRNYGYSKLSTFLESFDSIRIVKINTSYYATLDEENFSAKDVEAMVVEILKKSGKKSMNMGEVSQKIKEQKPNFNIRNYGYSKFAKLVTSFSSVDVKDQDVCLR